MDFGGEGSARKFPSSRASPPEPRAAAANRQRERRKSMAEEKRKPRAYGQSQEREGILHAAGQAPNPGQVNQTPALHATGSASPFWPISNTPAMSACMPTVIYSKSYSKKIICLQTWDSNYIIWTNAIIMPYENITIRSQILLASLDIKICQVSAWEILTKIFVTSQLEHVVRFKVLTRTVLTRDLSRDK